MDWKNFLIGAGGVALSLIPGGGAVAQLARAAGPALAVGAVGAAASKSAANTQAKAGEKALGIQKEYTDKALAKIDEADKRQADLYSPYLALGSGAGQTLAQGLGISMPAAGGPSGMATPSAVPMAPSSGMPLSSFASYRGPKDELPPEVSKAPELAAAATMTRGSSYGRGSGMVKIQAPDGEVREVPADHIAFYTQRGGKVVP